MKKLPKRWVLIGAIALAAIVLISLIAAPRNSNLRSGSTYNRSPDGYAAWYAYMEKIGKPVKRWQKPFEQLAGNVESIPIPKGLEISTNNLNFERKKALTLLRVNSTLTGIWLGSQERRWVAKGNTLIMLGVGQSVTDAMFGTRQETEDYTVKIETSRRKKQLVFGEKKILGDRFGAVVWERKLGEGRLIFATTPYIGANAYQDNLDNYKFLADLVTQGGNSALVDEYIHGYKDKDVTESEGQGDVISYLAKTPVASVLVQAGIMLLILIWAYNRRFGPAIALATPVVDNTEAYIRATAGVLQKANSSQFVLETVGKQEQLELQKVLGLGTTLLDPQTLIAAWVQQTGRSATELEELLQIQSKNRRIKERDLVIWLGKWQNIRSQFVKN